MYTVVVNKKKVSKVKEWKISKHSFKAESPPTLPCLSPLNSLPPITQRLQASETSEWCYTCCICLHSVLNPLLQKWFTRPVILVNFSRVSRVILLFFFMTHDSSLHCNNMKKPVLTQERGCFGFLTHCHHIWWILILISKKRHRIIQVHFSIMIL